MDRRDIDSAYYRWNGVGMADLGESDGSILSRAHTIQKELSTRVMEINAAKQSRWDTLWANLQSLPDVPPSGPFLKGKIPGSQTPFTGWGWTRDALASAGSKVVIPASRSPQTFISPIDNAEKLNRDVNGMITYYKGAFPLDALAMNKEKADHEAWLRAHTKPLTDPKAAFWDTFWDEIKKRGFTFGSITAIVVAGVIGIYLLARR